jgi:hypothetical protein
LELKDICPDPPPRGVAVGSGAVVAVGGKVGVGVGAMVASAVGWGREVAVAEGAAGGIGVAGAGVWLAQPEEAANQAQMISRLSRIKRLFIVWAFLRFD